MHHSKKKAKKMIKKYQTRDPLELAQCLNYNIIHYPFAGRTMGVSFKIENETIIGLNSVNNPYEDKQVLAHELGHSVLHEGMGFYCIRDNTLWPEGKFEKEADLFAATLLLDEPPEYGETVGEFAARKGVTPELVKKYYGIE